MAVFFSLSKATGYTAFDVLGFVTGLVGLSLLGYALFREKSLGDKTERVSPRFAVIVLGGIGLWVAFVYLRELSR